MKTVVLGVLFLGLTNLSFSQDEIAYADSHSEPEYKTLKSDHTHLDFINSIASVDISERILSFQSVAAQYDITEEAVYTPNQPATYTVTFKEAHNKIENLYSQDGALLSSYQTFSEIRLPYAISTKIAIEHPGWAIDKVDCTINYTQGEAVNIEYAVKLKNGDQTQSLKFTE
ncbi:hypothetical protein ACS386_13780 [Flavobacteriaceae bacterium LMO-SS05]